MWHALFVKQHIGNWEVFTLVAAGFVQGYWWKARR